MATSAGFTARVGLMAVSGAVVVLICLCAQELKLSGESVATDAVEVPVDRVVKNIEQLLAQSPTDVQLRVNLARVHMMAYVVKRATIYVPRNNETRGPVTRFLEENVMPTPTPTQDPLRNKEARSHLDRAIAVYKEAITRAPDHALARLGYAWSLQETGARTQAIDAYRDAVRVSLPQEVKRPGLMGWRSITEEAARYLIPLLEPEKDKDEIARLRSYTAQIKGLQRAITPIAIPLRDGLSADDLLDHSARVLFDLDGNGQRPWMWINDNAAWLVMDQHRRGRITSGLQLFGNVTFWLFWNNGYDALRSLDDDGDGAIAGPELSGLALWRDVNRNGVSDANEVRPVQDWHIVALSCSYVYDAQHPDEIAFSSSGVRFTNGLTRPTYNLVLHQGSR